MSIRKQPEGQQATRALFFAMGDNLTSFDDEKLLKFQFHWQLHQVSYDFFNLYIYLVPKMRGQTTTPGQRLLSREERRESL